MAPTMAPGHITVEAQWWSPSEIDLIIEALDIGTAARITSGGRDTGAGGTANTSGSAATTSYADTKRAASRNAVGTGSPLHESAQRAELGPVHVIRFPKPADTPARTRSIVQTTG
jgi:hypothetical protein